MEPQSLVRAPGARPDPRPPTPGELAGDIGRSVRDATTRLLLVFVVMFLIPSADLFHCIVGSCEVFFLAFLGEASFVEAFTSFILPTTVGNTVSGVLLVAVLNFAQTHDSTFSDRGTLT